MQLSKVSNPIPNSLRALTKCHPLVAYFNRVEHLCHSMSITLIAFSTYNVYTKEKVCFMCGSCVTWYALTR